MSFHYFHVKSTPMDIRKLFIITAACLLMAGCTKEGPTGPSGPAGPPGQDGNGSLHVESFTALNSDWEQLSNGIKYTRQVPSLTQDVIDNDAVLLYMHKNNIWYVLPYQLNVLLYTYSYQPGEITITITGTQIPYTLPLKLVYMEDSQ